MFSLYNTLLLLSVFSVCHGVDIKNYFQICSRDAWDVRECLIQAVQTGIDRMIYGIPELDTPPLDPYLQKDFEVNHEDQQMILNFFVATKFILKDIYLEGLKITTVQNVSLRASEHIFYLDVFLYTPVVRLRAEYSGVGQFQETKYSANGTLNTTATELKYTWRLFGLPEKIGDEIYLRIQNFHVQSKSVGSMHTTLYNKNPDSKKLTDWLMSFANKRWKSVIKKFLPYAQENWKLHGVNIANKIFLNIPYNQVFPSTYGYGPISLVKPISVAGNDPVPVNVPSRHGHHVAYFKLNIRNV